MREVPSGWREEQLATLVLISSGSAVPESRSSGSVPVMGANGQIGFTDRSNFGSGYLVGRVGAAGVVNRVDAPCWASDNVLTVVPRPGVVDGRFLEHLLKYADPSQLATRQAQPLVTQTGLGGLRVSFPESLKEQRRIAEILDTLDERLSAQSALIDKLVAVRDATASAYILNLDDKFSVRLADAAQWLSGGTPDTGNPDYWGGEIPWISAASLKDFYISNSERRVTRLGVVRGTRVVPKGTVIFVVRGMSLKSEFRIGVTKREVAFGQDCKALIPVPGVDPTYLAHAIRVRTEAILRMVDEAGHGTGRLATDQMKNITVKIPPIPKQQFIVEILTSMDEHVQKQKEELNKLRRLRQGLMDDLLAGRVRVPVGAGDGE